MTHIPELGRLQTMRGHIRFLTKVPDYGKDGSCWEWTGTKNKKGYGMFNAHNKHMMAHRASLAMVGISVPKLLVCDHECRNRACVNPQHIRLITNTKNVLIGYGPTAVNARKTHCKRGHPLSGSNLVIKLYKSGSKQRKCRECKNAELLAYRCRRKALCSLIKNQ